jgi:hypothetical protein
VSDETPFSAPTHPDTPSDTARPSDGTPVGESGASESEPTRRRRHMRRSEVITCRCGARWTDLRVAHCGECHVSFGGPSQFDLHRHQRGEHGGCLDPETITNQRGERLLFQRDDGVWRGPEMSDEAKAAAFGSRSAS